MFHLVLTVVVFASKQCSGQLGYGGSGYCSSCSLSNSGSTSQGFGFGGGNYASSSNAANLGLASQNIYSLPQSTNFILPNKGYIHGTNGYGTGAGYGNSHTGSALGYGSPTVMSWNNAYGSAGNYGFGSGYNCNNCLSNTGINTLPTSTDYGLVPSTYTSNGHSGLETGHSLPITYSSYPNYGSQSGINTLSDLFGYQRNQKVIAANDDSGIGRSSLSTSAPS
ncbi:unnamed protein product [Onchocerca ochengi]|uniref:Keratin, type I cytoskeletal 9-like n=1 Tax=Onchocerca ochengi TaxID=42157 RepID=A0A182EI40_ONCOC|nr:unnamed protein product [Onchocerca ochengi]